MPTSSQIRLPDSSLPTPSHTRLPARGVAPPRGGRTAGSGCPSHGACTGHRSCGPRPDRLSRTRHCSGYAGCSGEWGSPGTAFPCPGWTDGEDSYPVPSAPPIRLRGGSRCGPPPHLVVGRLGTRQDGRARHPEPGPDEGPAILSPDLWREGTFQRLPPPARFFQNVSLLNPSLDPVCTGGGFTPWLTCQGSVEASTSGGADASRLAQQLDGPLVLADSLRMATRIRLAVIPSADEALRDLGTFAFVTSYLFSAGARHS